MKTILPANLVISLMALMAIATPRVVLGISINDYFISDGYCLSNEYYSNTLFFEDTALIVGTRTQLWKMSEPRKPVTLAEINFHDDNPVNHSGSMVLNGNSIFWADGYDLYRWDILQPESHPFRGVTHFQQKIEIFAVRESIAYICTKNSFLVYDISDPFIAVKLMELPGLIYEKRALLLTEEKLIISDNAGIRIFSLNNPRQPQLQGTIESGSSYVDALAASDQLVCFYDSYQTEIWDISDGWNPRKLTELDAYSTQIALSEDGSVMVLINYEEWTGYDISDPANPRKIWKKEFESYCWDIRHSGRYLVRFSPFEIYEYSRFQRPTLVYPEKLNSNTHYTRITGCDELAAVSTDSSTILLDITAGCNQGTLSVIPQPFETAVFNGHTRLITACEESLNFLDVTQPSAPVLKASLTGLPADKLCINNGYLFVWEESQSNIINLLDISDFSNPQLIASTEHPRRIIAFAADDEVIVTLGNRNDVAILSGKSIKAPFENLWEIELLPDLHFYSDSGQINRIGNYWFIRALETVLAVKINGMNQPDEIVIIPELTCNQFWVDGSSILTYYDDEDRLSIFSMENPLKPDCCGYTQANSYGGYSIAQFQADRFVVVSTFSVYKYRYFPGPFIEMAGWQAHQTESGYHIQGFAQIPSKAVMRVEAMAGDQRTGILFNDNGMDGDKLPEDGIYTLDLTVDHPVSPGVYQVQISATDEFGRVQTWPFMNSIYRK